MQKFTRPITREIELGGERLALTLTEAGVSVRPVGSRRPPLELSWAALLGHMASGSAGEPSPEQLASAVQSLKGGARPSRPPSPAVATPPAAHPAPAAPGAEQSSHGHAAPAPAEATGGSPAPAPAAGGPPAATDF